VYTVYKEETVLKEHVVLSVSYYFYFSYGIVVTTIITISIYILVSVKTDCGFDYLEINFLVYVSIQFVSSYNQFLVAIR